MTALTPIAAVRPAPRLDRTTFVTSRLMDFCSVKELQAQTGHAVAEWPLVIVKELVDNALDAGEEAGSRAGDRHPRRRCRDDLDRRQRARSAGGDHQVDPGLLDHARRRGKPTSRQRAAPRATR